jgi:cyanophycinase
MTTFSEFYLKIKHRLRQRLRDFLEIESPLSQASVQTYNSRHTKMNPNKGVLALIGGAEDKTHEKTVLRNVLSINNAENVVIIPTASKYGIELGLEYARLFKSLGCKNPEALNIRYRTEVDLPMHLELVKKADMVFFTGGDQVKLVEILHHTDLYDLMRQRHFSNKMTIAGTSAGAASASEILIYDGDDFGFQKGSVKSGLGFGWLPDITIDTHFMERNRIPRLIQYLLGSSNKRGIGLSEDTSIFVYPNNKLEVIGGGAAVFIDTRQVNHTNYFEIPINGFIISNNVKISFLAHGSLFDLDSWDILVDRKALMTA